MESASLREIDVQVFPAYTGRVTKSWLRMVAGEALRSEDPDGSSAISLVIADDDTLRRLNLEFRGLDETTDVLAFPLEDAGHDQGPADGAFPDFPDEAASMGEIVISYPQAKRQARQAKKPLRSELALLVVHGVLHLLGYDHAEPEEERAMWAKQDGVMSNIALR